MIDYFFYTLGKYNDVNVQIINAARNHPSGEFAYDFNNPYGFRGYLFVFGGGVVSGVFVGSVNHHDGMMQIEGNISYFYDDVFTDPLDLRQIYSKNPRIKDMWWIERITEVGGTYFPLKDYWKTNFKAQAKRDEETSIYQWKQE